MRQAQGDYAGPARYAVEGIGSAEKFLPASGASQPVACLIVDIQLLGTSGLASGFLSKPFQREDLSMILGEAIER